MRLSGDLPQGLVAHPHRLKFESLSVNHSLSGIFLLAGPIVIGGRFGVISPLHETLLDCLPEVVYEALGSFVLVLAEILLVDWILDKYLALFQFLRRCGLV